MTRESLVFITPLSVFFVTVIFILIILPGLKRMKMGQRILEIGPAWHKSKEGTPTMGGIAPAAAVLLICFLLIILQTPFTIKERIAVSLTLLYAFANGAVGVIDDLTKFRHKENAGITARQKLFLQTVFAGTYLAELWLFDIINTTVYVPFFGTLSLPAAAFFPLALFFMTGTVNCANLTDGIDGLAASVNLIVGGFFCACGFLLYNNGTVLLGAAMLAASLAFLLFNYHPARLFMGDTGSLFFGALAIGCAVLCGRPLILLLCGAVYYAEGVSVVAQVLWFKISHGKRLFRMAPLHHHLEKGGWSEEKIVFIFTLLSLLGAVLAAFGMRA